MPRHKQPREVAELKGATKKDPQRYRKQTPKSEHALGEIPAWLSAGAKVVWFELEAYAASGVLTGADRMVMATLSELVAEFREGPREMSAARIGQMVGLLGRLGMSPADRQRLGTVKQPEGNPFEDF
jgi:phage terminase small subunit